MFEVEFSPPTDLRVRLGSWHFRTWRKMFMRLPKGYRGVELIYAVERFDEETGFSEGQFGAFFSEAAASACLARLESEGHRDLSINMIAVHDRLQDWQFNR